MTVCHVGDNTKLKIISGWSLKQSKKKRNYASRSLCLPRAYIILPVKKQLVLKIKTNRKDLVSK